MLWYGAVRMPSRIAPFVGLARSQKTDKLAT